MGGIFTDAGCLAIPALNCREAVSLTGSFGIRPDVVVVNPHLNGVEWMVQVLHQSHKGFRVVFTIESDSELTGAIRSAATLKRPRQVESLSREDCVEQVVAMLRRFRKLDTGTNS